MHCSYMFAHWKKNLHESSVPLLAELNYPAGIYLLLEQGKKYFEN